MTHQELKFRSVLVCIEVFDLLFKQPKPDTKFSEHPSCALASRQRKGIRSRVIRSIDRNFNVLYFPCRLPSPSNFKTSDILISETQVAQQIHTSFNTLFVRRQHSTIYDRNYEYQGKYSSWHVQSRLAERGGKWRPTPFSPGSLSMRPLVTC